jgi:ABC-type transporter Mla MlaB component
MVTKTDRLGLLSKMAMFVRNPTKDWSDLDKPEPVQESGYDKQALKAMIERKRQNDFVRRREFDQLRKLRRRETTNLGGLARPSIFQTSIATDPDGRAITLKKIDEIEAQMSKQWWKGKQDSSASTASDANQASMAVTERPEPFESTHSANSLRAAAEFKETQNGSGMVLQGSPKLDSDAHHPTTQSGSYEGLGAGFSSSELFAIEPDEMATDPELEEAAIRFANGDDAGAENGLLEALRQDAILPDVALSWAAALMDLYRATDNRSAFDAAVLEFAMRFDKLIPVWERISDGHERDRTNTHQAAIQPEFLGAGKEFKDGIIWNSPANLTVLSMEALREAMSSQPMPWHIGWTQLAQISDDAMPLLAGLFGSLCNEPVELRFSGVDRLVQALRSKMPSGDRSVSSAWWAVRLNALRTMKLHDEFELAALDCVTYEVSPPAWEPSRCEFESVGARESAGLDLSSEEAGVVDLSLAATELMGLGDDPSATLALRGDLLGDASEALVTLSEGQVGGYVVISCKRLVRVDFSAAGSILNWVAVRQSEGCVVQFKDVHRLVAAFFNVIGINEHARVIPRSI